jgi:hypothetical protein
MGKVRGQTAWIADGNVTGGNGSAQKAKLRGQLLQAKGSNS